MSKTEAIEVSLFRIIEAQSGLTAQLQQLEAQKNEKLKELQAARQEEEAAKSK